VKYLKHPSADYDIKPPLTDLNVGCGSYRWWYCDDRLKKLIN
jgi:hypothetical protein